MNILWRLAAYLKTYRLRLVVAILCSAGVAGLTLAYVKAVQFLVNDIFILKDPVILAWFPVALISVALLKALFTYSQAYLMGYIGHSIVSEVRQQLFGQLVYLPMGFYDDNKSGRLVAKVINDVNQMSNAIPAVFKDVLQQGLTFLALVGYTFYLNWALASVLFLVIPLSVGVIMKIGKKLRRFATRGQESIGDMASILKEVFGGIRIVKAYGTEEAESSKFHRTNVSFFRASVKSSQLSAISSPLMEMISVSGLAIIVWYGGFLILNNVMDPGEVSSFVAALFMSYAPIRKLAGANQSVQTAIAAAQSVFAILDLENEKTENASQIVLAPISRSLEFRDVTFFYTGKADPALKKICLKVYFGEVVALVGSSGSGKTTLASLIPRFYDPNEGMVFIDGHNIREVTLKSLRSQMAIVSQDTMLFDDSIRNNIAYGRMDATLEDIQKAAQAAYADEFINRLPDGMETIIGENGLKLSGGQRQRLAIARAVLRDPPILILDEATSSLDSESERIIQNALRNLLKNRTTIVIAHRLSTIQHADRIVVLQDGMIKEVGTHSQLIQHNHIYKNLYHAQFPSKSVETFVP
ncbi:MAG: ABC transporter transmembrane domain-containing protein [Nitrospirae bacterium]|nr:ABC transporter transmembrane domain-containing protein [Nitrospirota bacterium]